MNDPPDDASQESLLAEIADEFLSRVDRGQRPDIEQYATRYPQIAVMLRLVLPALEVMRLSAADACPPTNLAGRPGQAGQFGDFRILREIGRGGMGIVYEAEQVSLGRRVALKVLPLAGLIDSRRLQRFQNEARAAASLKHPNIVQVYSVGCEQAVHFYAMEYVEGQTLTQVIAAARAHLDEPRSDLAAADTVPAAQAETSAPASWRDAESFRQVARWGIQVAEALEYAHQLGVVHRDIKPSNLLIDPHGRLTVTDFGLAQTQTGMPLTFTGDVVGTLRYMSPEQAQGNRRVLDHRTDIYSLGVTLYELLALRPPFESDDRHTLLHQVLEGGAKPLRRIEPAIPRDLETVVLKAMAADPQARYATAQEMADDLGRFLASQPIRVRPPSLLDRAGGWSRRHRPLVRSMIASLLLVVVVLTVSTILVLRAYRGQMDQRLTAEANAVRATRNFDEARRAVRQMLTRVADEQLGAIPDMKEVRRRLLGDAVDFYTQLLVLNAEDPAVYSDRAEANMLLARYAEARADLTRAAELAPDNAAYQLQLGAFLGSCPDVAYRDLQRALVHTKRAVELEPQNAAYRGELIVAYVRLRAAAEAKAAIQQLVTITPPTARGFAELARVCLVAGDPQAALGWAEKASALEPAAEWTQLPLAEALAMLGEHRRATDVVNRALERLSSPADWQLPADWAHLLVTLGDDERGLVWISRAIESNLRPHDPRTFYLYDTRANIYYRQGKRAEALADLDKSLELGPFRSYAYKRRGRVHFDLGHYDQALRDVAKAVELKPDDLSNVYWIPLEEVARCPDTSFRQGILALIDRSAALNPGSAEASGIRGRAYQLLGNLEEEIARLERLRGESAEGAEWASRLAELRCLQVRRYSTPAEAEKAAGEYSEAVKRQPEAIEPYLERAVAWASSSQLDRAIDDLREALRRTPADRPSWLFWASCWLPAMTRGTTKPAGTAFVSDLAWVRSSCQLDGKPIWAGRDSCVWGPPVTLFPVPEGLACQKGCWAQPFDDRPAEIAVDLKGRKYARFKSCVGSTPQGTVQFRVLGDGKVLYETPVLRGGVVETISVDVRGVEELVLSANCGGDGPSYDAVNWGFARLVEDGAEDPLEEPPAELRSATEAHAALFLAEVHSRLGRGDVAGRWRERGRAWREANPGEGERLGEVQEEVGRRTGGLQVD